MKLIRLTSVFLCCALLSFILILPVSAADDDNYYSAPAVSDGSSLVSPASLGGIMLASATSWSTDDQAVLRGIYKFIQYLTVNPSEYQPYSVIGHLFGIRTMVSQIRDNMGGLDGIATETTLSFLSDKVATESTLSALNSAFSSFAYIWKYYYDQANWPNGVNPDGSYHLTNWSTVAGAAYLNLYSDTDLGSSALTLRGMVHRLQDTLASDDDRQLADNYKENRQQAEQDFLSGKSGKTSLGKDDFGSLSSVGGTFKDISSLNGQASLDSFSSGLSDADTAGQGWFSQSTKKALDSVTDSTSSTSTVSTFSDDGLSSVGVDPDPYNMGNFEDNYAWLWGDES